MQKFSVKVVFLYLFSCHPATAFQPALLPRTTTTSLHATPEETPVVVSPSSVLPARRSFFATTASATLTLTLAAAGLVGAPDPSAARLEAVDNPSLLPSQAGQNVIQVEKFLTAGQARNMEKLLTNLEKDTGFRLRVLCQAYPRTPGLAIRDYWDLGKEVRVFRLHVTFAQIMDQK
uniref:Uncharacterized protein n=1 Tax=Corethron hystrix TaxID=216773 RepID=A0A7S1BTV0_9STRA|mmetsp:Transcript_40846/g.95836  ORF Transcript_40846/g.95836 Transcript_40846/m.95836 type:complete len:176 (+) Transcript_40846:225-752(+)